MSQESLEKFLSKYDLPGKVTFFSHQHFTVLDKTVHEVCPHPFIVDLSVWKENLKELESQLLNKPKGLRNHSCVFSHMIAIDLFDLGYIYSSNVDYLYKSGIIPYRHPWGIWELPIYYMDNMDFWMSKNWNNIAHQPFDRSYIESAIKDRESLYVFDIHPLHVALNTRKSEDYTLVKDKIIKQGICPFELRFSGRGTAIFFEELCDEIIKSNQRSYSCTEALKYFQCI